MLYFHSKNMLIHMGRFWCPCKARSLREYTWSPRVRGLFILISFNVLGFVYLVLCNGWRVLGSGIWKSGQTFDYRAHTVIWISIVSTVPQFFGNRLHETYDATRLHCRLWRILTNAPRFVKYRYIKRFAWYGFITWVLCTIKRSDFREQCSKLTFAAFSGNHLEIGR